MRLFFVPARFVRLCNGVENSAQILRGRLGYQCHRCEAGKTDHQQRSHVALPETVEALTTDGGGEPSITAQAPTLP
jgi:hypothetical protein